ncbi:hypothetical protein [Alistipes sp.]|uniref:hypothetical protein n=1 Tax=Alistipes sp. TaxID=1872444 RepID=UPI003AF6D1A0
MYRRFLNDGDYLGLITQEALSQMTRGYAERFVQAEESAEMSIVEYLSENYEVERELAKGKYIADYDRRITFPVGAYIYYEGKICEVIRSLCGYKMPATVDYWEEYIDLSPQPPVYAHYSQFGTYYTGDITDYNGVLYRCLCDNGWKFGQIRIPMVGGWQQVECTPWQPMEYNLWKVVSYEGGFYTLISLEGFDYNLTPLESDCWGAVADYDPEYNAYDLNGHDYVVYQDVVFVPETDVNADVPESGQHLIPGDPRNYNLKKHMVRLALYELAKLIAPNNVSVVRMRDYEDSMRWLSDAAKLRLNPQIPRKVAEDSKPVMDWQLATFQNDYDPYKNPWLT